jgi:hypothetical protein
MSTTRRRPACAAPGWSRARSFGAPKVTVSAARTAGPRTRPVSPSTPEGTSTAITRPGAPFIASMASA